MGIWQDLGRPDQIAVDMEANPVQEDLLEIILDKDQLAAGVARLGATLAADYAGQTPLLVGVLKGAVIFLSDLIRAMDIPLRYDFMAVSS